MLNTVFRIVTADNAEAEVSFLGFLVREKFALTFGWARKKGDWWSNESHKKRKFIWTNGEKGSLYIGRLAIRAHKPKELNEEGTA